MGTATAKQYQTTDVQASMPGLTMPEQVSVALAEIAESATRACWPWPWLRRCSCWGC
jgi:hypothetical protein